MSTNRHTTLRAVKQTLLQVIPSLKDRKYKLGGNGKVIGNSFDCFGLLVEYTKLRFGIDILKVHSFSGYDFNEYHMFCESLAMENFLSYLNQCFSKVVPSYKMSGDIMSCTCGKDSRSDVGIAVGIYLGKKKMLITSPITDCIIISTEHYDIRNVYRWPLLSR